jgi:hypothetical protein
VTVSASRRSNYLTGCGWFPGFHYAVESQLVAPAHGWSVTRIKGMSLLIDDGLDTPQREVLPQPCSIVGMSKSHPCANDGQGMQAG